MLNLPATTCSLECGPAVPNQTDNKTTQTDQFNQQPWTEFSGQEMGNLGPTLSLCSVVVWEVHHAELGRAPFRNQPLLKHKGLVPLGSGHSG